MKALLFRIIIKKQPDQIQPDRRRVNGQAFVEMLMVLPILTTLLFGGGALLYHFWKKNECAHLVFETTHRALLDSQTRSSPKVSLQQDSDGITGQARCESATETVRLPRLEREEL